MSEGAIILIEGHDFAGKSTIAEKLEQHFKALSHQPVVYIHSPSGINDITNTNYNMMRIYSDTMRHNTKLLMILACHAEIIPEANKLKDAGYIVILDRSLLSTLIYQDVEYNTFHQLCAIVDMPILDYDDVFVLHAHKNELRRRVRSRNDSDSLDDYFMQRMDRICELYQTYPSGFYPESHMVDTTNKTPSEVFGYILSKI